MIFFLKKVINKSIQINLLKFKGKGDTIPIRIGHIIDRKSKLQYIYTIPI